MDDRLTAKYDLIDKIHQDTIGRNAVITSARDGKHMVGSLHFVGRAIDLRTRDMPLMGSAAIAESLREVLGKDFDVVLEKDHIHLEYDPKNVPK